MGTAVSMLVFHPVDTKGCLLALMGGAVGGVLADIDTLDDDYHCDALIGQLIGIGIAALSLAIDYFFHIGICNYILNRNRIIYIVGGIAILILLIIGFSSDHRTFTHSFLGMGLYTLAIAILLPMVALPFLVGYCTHLSLDLLNKKPVPLLYPREKGICLYLFYAKGYANTTFMILGIISTIVLIIVSIIR